MSKEQKILEFLLDGKKSTLKEIHLATDINVKTVHTTINALRRKGKVVKLDRGIYRLTDGWINNKATLRQYSESRVIVFKNDSPELTCTKCAATKQRGEFYANSRGTGVNQPCKECTKQVWLKKKPKKDARRVWWY